MAYPFDTITKEDVDQLRATLAAYQKHAQEASNTIVFLSTLSPETQEQFSHIREMAEASKLIYDAKSASKIRHIDMCVSAGCDT